MAINKNLSGTAITRAVELTMNNGVAAFYSLPNIQVSRPGKISLSGYIQGVNFITGGNFILDTATMNSSRQITFINTGLNGAAIISLSNGGTISGQPTYAIPAGTGDSPIVFNWDGTNLS